MILEDELPAFMEEVRRRALLACDNKPEYVKALRESPTFLFVLQAEFRLGNLLLQLGLKKVFVRQFSVVLGDSSESPLLRFDGIQWQLQSIVLYRRNLPLISLRDQNHLPRGCAPECIGMGVSVEGAAKSLHLPR